MEVVVAQRKKATKKHHSAPGWTRLLSRLRTIPTGEARALFADVADGAKLGKGIGITRYDVLRGVIVSPQDAALLMLLKTKPELRVLRKGLMNMLKTM